MRTIEFSLSIWTRSSSKVLLSKFLQKETGKIIVDSKTGKIVL